MTCVCCHTVQRRGIFLILLLTLCSPFQVFRARTPPEAIALVSRLLEYTPGARISPLQACAHPFFNELREAYLQLPSGRGVPPLFNFTEHGECQMILTCPV